MTLRAVAHLSELMSANASELALAEVALPAVGKTARTIAILLRAPLHHVLAQTGKEFPHPGHIGPALLILGRRMPGRVLALLGGRMLPAVAGHPGGKSATHALSHRARTHHAGTMPGVHAMIAAKMICVAGAFAVRRTCRGVMEAHHVAGMIARSRSCLRLVGTGRRLRR
jgi:hypothetical protein